jgi:hypothetical protein
MEVVKRKKIEAAGWSISTARGFLKLSAEKSSFVDLVLLCFAVRHATVIASM